MFLISIFPYRNISFHLITNILISILEREIFKVIRNVDLLLEPRKHPNPGTTKYREIATRVEITTTVVAIDTIMITIAIPIIMEGKNCPKGL